MADENIGKLVLTIGADIGELARSFVQTAQHVNEIKKAVAGVNFEQMVKNASVTARVIQSLRTQTVNGFADVVTSVKKVGKSIGEANKHLSIMQGNAISLSKTLSSLPFGKILDELTQIRKNTSGVSSGFKTLNSSVVASGKAFRRQEFDLHRVILRLDALKRSMGGFQKGMGAGAAGLRTSISHAKILDSTYRRLAHSMSNAGRMGAQSSHQMAKGLGVISMSMLSGSRIMRAFQHNFIDGLSLMSAEFWVLSMAARTTYRALMAFPTKAIKSVDEYRLSVIKTQALISTFSPKDVDFGISFKNARDYARDLVAEMDILAAFTLGTSFDLQAITQEFMKQGVLVDINNQKTKDAFLNIANAIEIIASGFQAPELQIRQEARALAMGQVDLRATLATELNARLGGQLKERIALWKQENTFIENTGNLLQGYAESIKDIRNTWKSISALFKTMSDRILRFGSEAFYEAINEQLRKMTNYLQEHEILIATKLHAGWKRLLIISESLKRSYETLQEPILILIELGAKFFKGWGFLLVGVIPVALERISLLIRFVYNEGKSILGLWMQIGQAIRDAGTDWSFSGTKLLEQELKMIGSEQDQIIKILGGRGKGVMGGQVDLFSQAFNPPNYGILDDMKKRMKDFEDDVNIFKQSLGRKGVKTPEIMAFIDREKIESEYDAFLNSTSVKTSRWLDEESRMINKHRESLIRNKKLLIEDEAAIAKHALSVITNVMPGGGLLGRDIASETAPFVRFKSMGTKEYLQEYIKIVVDADKKTKELIKDINTIADIQLMEKAEERRKMIAAPSVAISQRYSSPMQKSMSELTEFIKNQRLEIKKLVMSELLTQAEADKLFIGLDRNAIAERGRIVEESFQKIREEIAKSDAFIAERARGKNDLAARLAKENEELARAQRELSRIYTQGIILKKDFDSKMEAMSRASTQRKILIEEQFNSEMLSKQLSLRKSQLSVAEIELTMSRGAVAKERLVLSQQELEQELRILDTLSRIEGVGSLAWSEQREKVEELRESIANLGQTVRETTGTMGEGMRYATEKFIRDSSTNFEYGVQFVNDAASGMTSFISGVFSDLRNRDLKSWKDYALGVIDVFASIAEKMLAEIIITQALKMMGHSRNTTDIAGVATTGALTIAFATQIPVINTLTAAYWALAIAKMAAGVGGGGAGISSAGTAGAATTGTASASYGGILVHDGGSIPRFHKGGLSSDEVLSVLQTGEYVINKNAAKRIGKPTLDSLNSSPGIARLSSKEFSETSGASGTTINQAIHFNIKEPMDAYSFDAYLERSHGKVKKIVADGIDQSMGFKKQMRGRNK